MRSTSASSASVRRTRRRCYSTRAWLVGSARTLDEGRADDKILTVLDRLCHYFAFYKGPRRAGEETVVRVLGTYGAAHAHQVVEAAIVDYESARREALGGRDEVGGSDDR